MSAAIESRIPIRLAANDVDVRFGGWLMTDVDMDTARVFRETPFQKPA
jgi:hypothetical protein